MATNRRSFIKDSTLLTAAGLVAARQVLAQAPPQPAPTAIADALRITKRGDMPYRTLGRTGEAVSIVGLGGHHIGTQADEAESIRLIHAALDGGINFLDNCWDYNDGQSEIRMGKALVGRRDKAFLMTKIDGRTKESAARQIDESLRRLQTDRIDLMQIHEVIRMEDPDRIFSANGTMEALREAKAAGKIRFIGFTGHKDPIVHLRLIEAARKNGFTFDAAQMPINIMDAHFRSFARDNVPALLREGTAILAMKTFGGGPIQRYVRENNIATPIELLHYSMTQPVATVITGCDSMPLVEQALQAARTFEPMSAARSEALLAKVKDAALTGRHERFKTSDNFDGTAKNPQWLR